MEWLTTTSSGETKQSHYVSVCVSLQSLLYKRVHEAQFRSTLANEMMMYHMNVSPLAPPTCQASSAVLLVLTQVALVAGLRR